MILIIFFQYIIIIIVLIKLIFKGEDMAVSKVRTNK